MHLKRPLARLCDEPSHSLQSTTMKQASPPQLKRPFPSFFPLLPFVSFTASSQTNRVSPPLDDALGNQLHLGYGTSVFRANCSPTRQYMPEYCYYPGRKIRSPLTPHNTTTRNPDCKSTSVKTPSATTPEGMHVLTPNMLFSLNLSLIEAGKHPADPWRVP
jgi:hypothetical protein